MTDENLIREAYKKTFKLALAVSIIRSKPQNLSAKEYAAKLATDLKKSEVSWKSKYEKVNGELVETKQQVVLLQLKNESLRKNIPLDEKRPLKYEPPSGEDMMDTEESSSPIGTMSLHSKFLSSVLSFQQWNVLLQKEDQSIKTVMSSIETSLRDFDSCLEKTTLNEHNLSLIKANMKTIVDLTKKDGITFDKNLLDCCSNIVRSLIKVVMNSNAETPLCEQVTEIIILLGQSCASMRDIVLENLVNITNGYSLLLKELPRFTSLDISKYHNMFFICEALKDTFSSTYKTWPSTRFGTFSSTLDDAIMTIANTFPMYAHSLWLISSLMADAQSECETKHFLKPKQVIAN